MAIEELYNQSFDLYNYTTTGRNQYGGVTKQSSLKQASIPCYFTQLFPASEPYFAGRVQVFADHKLFCKPIDVTSEDKVYLMGQWFGIQGWIDNCNNMDHHFEILLRSIDAPQIFGGKYWVWGYDFPSLPTHVTTVEQPWSYWFYEGTNIVARNSGSFGQLQLKNTEKFVSNIVDTRNGGNKKVTIKYDTYNTGSHNSGRLIWWRGSDFNFTPQNNTISWNSYSSLANTMFRFIQLRVGIYV